MGVRAGSRRSYGLPCEKLAAVGNHPQFSSVQVSTLLRTVTSHSSRLMEGYWIRGRSVPSSRPQRRSWQPEGVGQMGDAGIGFDGLLPPLQLRGLTVPGTLFADNTPNQFREAGVLQSAWH